MDDQPHEKAPHGAGQMGFVQREIDRVNAALNKDPDGESYDRLYAAQQALSWALEPQGFKSPFDMIVPSGCRETAIQQKPTVHVHVGPSGQFVLGDITT